jgi:molecular chaperone GrpE
MPDEDKKEKSSSEQDEVITFSGEEEEIDSHALIKKLRERLKNAEEKAQEYLTGWQKERADSVNARKRMEEEKKEFAKFANENLVMEILPALDSFDLAMANKKSWAALPQEWTKGIEYIYTQLLSALETQGVKRIYPLHEKFDPGVAEALDMIPVDNEDNDHKVLEVIQPGYSFHGKVVRTAKVKVGELK